MIPGPLPQNVNEALNAPAPSSAALAALMMPSAPLPTGEGPSQSLSPAPGTSPISGLNALGGGPEQEGSAPQKAAGTFAEKLARAADKLGIPTQRDGQPVPGGWARSLVGATVHALSGGTAALGDAAAGMGRAEPGQGALAGMAQALQARGQRIAGEKAANEKQRLDDVQIAHAQAQTLLAHQTLRIVGNEAKQKAYESDQAMHDDLAAVNTPTLTKGLNDEQLADWWKKNPNMRGKAIPVMDHLEKEVDAEGNEFLRPSFTLYDAGEPIKPGAKSLELINKYGSQSGKLTEGTQLPAGQYAELMSRARNAEVQDLARQQIISKANLSKAEAEKVEQEVQDKKTHNQDGLDIASTMNHYGRDIASALDGLAKSQDPKAAEISHKIEEFYGPTLVQKALEASNKTGDELKDIQKDLNKADGQHAAEISADLQTRLDDKSKPPTPSQKQDILRMKAQADAKTTASLTYAADRKTREAAAEEAANAGDMGPLKDMALQYQVNPIDLFSRLKGKKQLDNFLAEIHKADPTWSMAKYKERFETIVDFRPKGKGGDAVQGLNTFTGHLGDANGLISSLQNTRSPLLNQSLNSIKKQLGNDKIQPYIGALAATSHEYINFLNNQHAKTQSDEALAAKLIDENTSPAAAQAIMRQMAQTVAIRGRSLNDAYKHTMGVDYPDMLSPESAQIMRNFGIDIGKIGGVTGETPSGLSPGPKGGINPMISNDGKTEIWQVGNQWVTADGKPYKP